MSSIRLRTVADYMHHGILVGVRCRSCGHSVKLPPAGLYILCLRRRWSIKVEALQSRFRCQCGIKNSEIYQGGLVTQGI